MSLFLTRADRYLESLKRQPKFKFRFLNSDRNSALHLDYRVVSGRSSFTRVHRSLDEHITNIVRSW